MGSPAIGNTARGDVNGDGIVVNRPLAQPLAVRVQSRPVRIFLAMLLCVLLAPLTHGVHTQIWRAALTGESAARPLPRQERRPGELRPHVELKPAQHGSSAPSAPTAMPAPAGALCESLSTQYDEGTRAQVAWLAAASGTVGALVPRTCGLCQGQTSTRDCEIVSGCAHVGWPCASVVCHGDESRPCHEL